MKKFVLRLGLKDVAACGSTAFVSGIVKKTGPFNPIVKKGKLSSSAFVKKGIVLGRRPEQVGGGLIRSLAGWDEIKKMRLADRIASRVINEY